MSNNTLNGFQKFIQNSSTNCSKVICYLNELITMNIDKSTVETRPGASHGLWCCALLPAVLMLYSTLYKVSLLYHLVAYVSLGLLFYCVLFIIFMSVSCMVLRDSIYGGCIASSLVSTLLLYTFLNLDLSYSLLLSLPTIYIFSNLLRTLIAKCPKTFTIGEAMLVGQGIVLYASMVLYQLVMDEWEYEQTVLLINAVVNTVLSTVGFIVTALYLLREEHRNLDRLAIIMGTAAVFALVVLHSALGLYALPTILTYVFFYKDRSRLVTFWLFILIIAIVVLSLRTKMAVKADTVSRKSFHVLASLVFMSGIILDPELMMLAAGIGLGVLILAEAFRKSGIEPMSSTLQSAFAVYSDEKDCGTFAMTPIYLYCGLACPLLLAQGPLEALSGVLAIGVGDSAASWFGSKYGYNKWADSKKSVEGTLFNILSQICTVYALQLFNLITCKHALLRTAVAATISGVVEAKTDQVDNLVLPLVMLLSYQLTWFLH